MEVLILGVYLEIFLFRIKWSKIRVRIIHGRALYMGKYGMYCVPFSQKLFVIQFVNSIISILVVIKFLVRKEACLTKLGYKCSPVPNA